MDVSPLLFSVALTNGVIGLWIILSLGPNLSRIADALEKIARERR